MEIEISYDDARGESGGIPRLTLYLKAKNVSNHNLAILNVYSEIRVGSSMYDAEMAKSPFVGNGLLEYHNGQFSNGTEQKWTLDVALDAFSLQKIEETRRGGDLFLRVLFYCVGAYIQDATSGLTNVRRLDVQVGSTGSAYCPFKIPESDWEKILKDLDASGLSNAEEEIRQASKRAQQTLREMEGLSAKAKEAAAIVGVGQHASYFDDEASGHTKVSFRWLVLTVFLALAAAVYSLWSFRQSVSMAGEGAVAWWPHLTYLTSRLVVLSVIFFGIGWSARNYRAHKHNEIVNRHRQNALRTFETFARAADDKDTKDAVLLQATKSIFEAQSSGYLVGEPEKIPSSTVIEVLRKAMSKEGPS